MFSFLTKKNVSSKILPQAPSTFFEDMGCFDKDPYVTVVKSPLNILTVFDDIRYDRSDIDNLSPGMYRYIHENLTSNRFERVSGRVFQHTDYDLKCEIPKSRVQGASPFHSVDYTGKRQQDFYILTPTQTAAVIINTCSHNDAIEKIVKLVTTHPINLFKLKDHLEERTEHIAFSKAIAHIKYKQRIALENPKLKKLKSLR